MRKCSCGRAITDHPTSKLCAKCYNDMEDIVGGHTAVKAGKEFREWSSWAKRQNRQAGACHYNLS